MPGQHESIISQELFDHVQGLLDEAPRRAPQSCQDYAYAGLIHCVECDSAMSPSHSTKKEQGRTRRYRYYRCTSTNHKGWAACTTRQISAERFENLIESNLMRISKDKFFLENLVFSLKNQTGSHDLIGIEPRPDFQDLTPEILQKSLQGHINKCARKTGIEKALAVRGRIMGIRYGKETVSVEFAYGPISDEETHLDQFIPSAVPSAAARLSTLPPVKAKRPSRLKRPDPLTLKMWS